MLSGAFGSRRPAGSPGNICANKRKHRTLTGVSEVIVCRQTGIILSSATSLKGAEMKMVLEVRKVWRRLVAVTWAADLQVGDVVYAGYRPRNWKNGTHDGYVTSVPNPRQAGDSRFRKRNGVAHATVEAVEETPTGVRLTLGGIPCPVMVARYDRVCVVGKAGGWPWWSVG